MIMKRILLVGLGLAIALTLAARPASAAGDGSQNDRFGQDPDACLDGYRRYAVANSDGPIDLVIIPCSDKDFGQVPVYAISAPRCPENPEIEADNLELARAYIGAELSLDRGRVRDGVRDEAQAAFADSIHRPPPKFIPCEPRRKS